MKDREYHRNYSRNYYYQRKNKLIKMLGGKCVKCGKTNELHFDHIDPKTREFKIGKLLNYSWEKIIEEIKKCQLLCKKCHINKSRTEGSLARNNKIFRGSENGKSKLNEEQVKEIKSKLGIISCSKLALLYNVKLSTIKSISCGLSWKHI